MRHWLLEYHRPHRAPLCPQLCEPLGVVLQGWHSAAGTGIQQQGWPSGKGAHHLIWGLRVRATVQTCCEKCEESICQLSVIPGKKRQKESRGVVTSRGRTRVALLRLALFYSVVPLRSTHEPIPYEDSKRMCQSNPIKSILVYFLT